MLAIAILTGTGLWVLLAGLALVLIVERPLNDADAIVVLSGAESYVERVDEAALLYRAGISKKIVITNDGLRGGWNDSEKRNPYFYERAKSELISKGVPESAIEVLMAPADGTYHEARAVIDNALREDQRSILIVTSPYHTRRALWTYQKIDSTTDNRLTLGIKSASEGLQSPKWYSWWLSMAGWKTVVSEYVKLAYYRYQY